MARMTFEPWPVKISTSFNWWPGARSAAEVGDLLFSHDLGFEPNRVHFRVAGVDIDTAFDARGHAVLKDSTVSHWSILIEPEEWGAPAIRGGHQTTLESMDFDGGVPPMETLDALARTEGFTLGTRGDGNDSVWQGETSINNYQVYKRPYDHLPTVWDPVWKRDEIDVRGNPGRMSHTVGMRPWAGTDVWFGPAAARVMDYERVPTIPVGQLRSLGDDVWHLHLYDLDEPEAAIREKQAALREHLQWDEIEEDTPRREEELRAALKAAEAAGTSGKVDLWFSLDPARPAWLPPVPPSQPKPPTPSSSPGPHRRRFRLWPRR